MIRIRIYEDSDGKESLVTILVQGHAGYAQKGNDIVCAAISAAVSALSEYAVEEDPDAETAENADDVEIRFKLDSSTSGKMLAGAFNAFVILARRVADQYPGHVSIKWPR